jgi:ribosomal protein L7/L12
VGKVIIVVVVIVVLALALRIMLRRRERGAELFVTEARGYEPVGGPLEDEVRALMRRGQKIHAIKLVRERTGLGLADAKDAVEGLAATGRLRVPGGPRGGGPAKIDGLAPADVLAQARMLKAQRKGIEAIKLIRAHTGLGLKEAKDLYDSL